MKKRTITVIAIVIVVSLIAITVVLSMSPNNTESLIDSNQKYTEYDYTEGIALVSGEYRDPVYNDITGDYRPIYEGMSDEQYDWYFSELPSFPEDFFEIANLIYDGKITDYSRLSENYWKQPEFFPTWFSSIGKYINHNEERWRPEGYGCYPTIKEVRTSAKGSTITINTYFRTAFDTNSYQGLIVKPYLPEKAVSLLGNTIFEQSENAAKYLKVSIGNPDDPIYESFKDTLPYSNVEPGDWMTILKPTHLIIRDKYGNRIGEEGFPEDWVRIVELNIEIASNTPSGDYVVALDIETPCFAINQEYYYSTNHAYYGGLYYPAGGFFRSSTPHFQAIIRIE